MNIFDEEQLIAYWGKGLDKFTIKCLREKKWLPNNRYINICYKGIVFTQVFFLRLCNRRKGCWGGNCV